MFQLENPYHLVAACLFGSAAVAVAVAIQAARHRTSPVWRYFVYAMAFVAIWGFSDASFFVLAANDDARWGWMILGYSASVMSVPVIFAFALYFARLDHWLTPIARVLLWSPFLLAVALAFTNRWTGWVWERSDAPLQITGSGGHGVYFVLMLPIAYGLTLAAVVIILQSSWRLHDLYRRQAIVLSVAVLLPLVSSMLYFTDLNPIPNVDLAPAFFALSGPLLLYGMSRLHVLELRPIYRDAVFQHMCEGAMILDAAGRIVDINPAAQRFLTQCGQTLGDDGRATLARNFVLDGVLELTPGAHHLVTTPEHPPRCFDLRVAEIGGHAEGVLLIWRDMTQLRAALATMDAQEHYIAARARAEADLTRDIEHAVTGVRIQVQNALDYLEQGRLGITAALLAEINAVTTESLLRRTQAFYTSGIQAADFYTAIRQYASHFAHLHELQLTIVIDAELDAEQLAPDVRLHMVRVLQAALDNVGRHARSQQVETRIERTGSGVVLAVRDNGAGFDPAHLLPGMPEAGFATMARRMAMVQGSLEITAAPGAGVTVCAFFPAARVQGTALHGKRVLLAVDHPLTRDGLRAMLTERGLYVDAAVSGCDALLMVSASAAPDVILLDIDLPDIAAPATIRQVRAVWPAARIVVLSEETHPRLSAAFHNGADGYVLKTLPADAFFDALAQVVSGEQIVAPGMATQVLAEFRQQETVQPERLQLTARQQEILRLVTLGLTYAEIANRLQLSERTVRYHIEEIRRRLGLANRNEVALYARRHHLAD